MPWDNWALSDSCKRYHDAAILAILNVKIARQALTHIPGIDVYKADMYWDGFGTTGFCKKNYHFNWLVLLYARSIISELWRKCSRTIHFSICDYMPFFRKICIWYTIVMSSLMRKNDFLRPTCVHLEHPVLSDKGQRLKRYSMEVIYTYIFNLKVLRIVAIWRFSNYLQSHLVLIG